MKTRPLYQAIANAITALHNCEARNNPNDDYWLEQLAHFEDLLPSGSGFDSGTIINIVDSTRHKLVLETKFHHMNDAGFYTKWTDHKITVVADMLFGFDLKISGQNHNGIKDYIGELFMTALAEETEPFVGSEHIRSLA